MRLVVLNNGRETFVRVGVIGSILDSSFASSEPRCRELWCLETDSWRSNHVTIRLISINARPRMIRTHHVTNWDAYCQQFHELHEHGSVQLFHHGTCEAMSLPTRTITVSSKCPVQNLKHLNLRTTRRKAHQVAQRTDDKYDWIAYRKVDTVFHRRTHLHYNQWRPTCASLDARLPTHRT